MLSDIFHCLLILINLECRVSYCMIKSSLYIDICMDVIKFWYGHTLVCHVVCPGCRIDCFVLFRINCSIMEHANVSQ